VISQTLIADNGGVSLLAEVLFGKHHNNEAAHRYALSALWNLAFNDASRKEIIETPGLVDAIRNILATTESPKTKEVAKGALWTLGRNAGCEARSASMHQRMVPNRTTGF
jgi:phosphopantothenate-cysteine ligase